MIKNFDPSTIRGIFFIHTSDPDMVEKFKKSGVAPINVVGNRYTFIYNETTKLTCDAYDRTSYVVNNVATF